MSSIALEKTLQRLFPWEHNLAEVCLVEKTYFPVYKKLLTSDKLPARVLQDLPTAKICIQAGTGYIICFSFITSDNINQLLNVGVH